MRNIAQQHLEGMGFGRQASLEIIEPLPVPDERFRRQAAFDIPVIQRLKQQVLGIRRDASRQPVLNSVLGIHASIA
ncbi:hypothetical protein [Qingshengfaniella alkalisoli]|uniref:hypothetical protein n=1 Tax=Qingshengfaniella alkalisoli TaxID=2599296 RepID=UPI00143CE026|nr:hypothetical protein [Qingshengfaniella alkalisoli]